MTVTAEVTVCCDGEAQSVVGFVGGPFLGGVGSLQSQTPTVDEETPGKRR